jgi:hypothetical protein
MVSAYGSIIGLVDKLYWREVRPGRWHCFARSKDRKYVSLCGEHERERSGGQRCSRPRPVLRCGLCDGREAYRRGWDEPAP